MPGLVPGIHVLLLLVGKDVDGRDKHGHDENYISISNPISRLITECVSAPEET
jgi:hypothetical protein